MKYVQVNTTNNMRYEALFHEPDILPEDMEKQIMQNIYNGQVITVRIPGSDTFIKLYAPHIVTYSAQSDSAEGYRE